MKNLVIAVGLWFAVSSCDQNNIDSDCYHGKVIMSSCCTGSTFIEIDSATPIGKATTLNGESYQNMIQVPGYLHNGDIFLNLRQFDQQKDQSLFPSPRCYCLIAIGMDVPTWVQTAHSYNACPIDGR